MMFEKEKLAALETEERFNPLRRFEADLAAAKADAIEAIREERAKLQADMAVVRKEREKSETEREKLLVDLAAAMTERAQLETDLVVAKTDCKKLEKDLIASRTECEKLLADLAATKTECENMESDLAIAKTECRNLETDLAAARNECENMEADLTAARTERENLETDLITAKTDAAESQDRFMRTAAEFDNYRKRVDKEKTELRVTSQSAILRDILHVLDGFDRALKYFSKAGGAGTVEQYREGVELLARQVLDTLAQSGVEPIAAKGTPFDPHLHEALSLEETFEVADGIIVSEVRRGYMFKDNLLRPAQVIVAVQPKGA
jgi:molecular chaperone GrpE